MCGIFGWVADYHDTEPDPRLMQLAADGAANRGPHAHGWAIPGQPTHRALGPLDPAHLPSGARVLGHARLATYGQSTDLAAVQPIEVDGHHLVHNGNAAAAYGEYPHAPSDTAALAIIYAAHRTSGHPPAAALTYTAARIDSVWALAVLDSDGSLWVSRHGQPLHILRTHSGLYLSSGELPGSHLVPEHYTLQLAEASRQTGWTSLMPCAA